jgi:hypothetical protein
MPDESCLNLRLGDYFHERREPIAEPCAAQPPATPLPTPEPRR